MKITIQANTKAEMVQKIVKATSGVVKVKAAKKIVKNMKNGAQKKFEVKTPAWFRIRGKGGKFVKSPKMKAAKKIVAKKYNRDRYGRFKKVK